MNLGLVYWLPMAAVLTLILLALLWLLIVAEGSYLGSRAVVFLYDRAAGVYDTVKARSARHDRRWVALPLARTLSDVAHSLVLDVATGTGRVPLLLADWPFFGGHIIGLDLSANMLSQAKQRTREFRDVISLTRQDALSLSFADHTFDAVSCLEGLELFPRPEKALQEMARVLRLGGVLLFSSRVGWEAKLLPGRTYDASRLRAILHSLSLEEVRMERWQRSYDLVWARKGGGNSLRPLSIHLSRLKGRSPIALGVVGSEGVHRRPIRLACHPVIGLS